MTSPSTSSATHEPPAPLRTLLPTPRNPLAHFLVSHRLPQQRQRWLANPKLDPRRCRPCLEGLERAGVPRALQRHAPRVDWKEVDGDHRGVQGIEHLRVVECYEIFAAGIPYLTNIKTLHVDDPADGVEREVKRKLARAASRAKREPERGNLRTLERLQSDKPYPVNCLLELYALPNLVELSLHIWIGTAQLEQALPTLTNLRSLRLEFYSSSPTLRPSL